MSHPWAWALPILHPSQGKVWAQGILTPSEAVSLTPSEGQHSHCYSGGWGGEGLQRDPECGKFPSLTLESWRENKAQDPTTLHGHISRVERVFRLGRTVGQTRGEG